jgi:cell division protein FtsB
VIGEGGTEGRFGYLSTDREREVLRNRKKRPIWIRLVIGVVIAGVLALIYLSGNHGYLAILKLQEENRQLDDQIAALEKDNQELEAKLARDGKYTNEEYIRIAREVLGWVMPGERVYRFVNHDDKKEGDAKP